LAEGMFHWFNQPNSFERNPRGFSADQVNLAV